MSSALMMVSRLRDRSTAGPDTRRTTGLATRLATFPHRPR